jgi:hypothetical protein
MTTDSLWTRIREKPFRPFSLHVSGGQSYPVRHPEYIAISKNRIVISIEERDQPDELPDRQVVISPLHVTAAEDLLERTSAA